MAPHFQSGSLLGPRPTLLDRAAFVPWVMLVVGGWAGMWFWLPIEEGRLILGGGWLGCWAAVLVTFSPLLRPAAPPGCAFTTAGRAPAPSSSSSPKRAVTPMWYSWPVATPRATGGTTTPPNPLAPTPLAGAIWREGNRAPAARVPPQTRCAQFARERP